MARREAAAAPLHGRLGRMLRTDDRVRVERNPPSLVATHDTTRHGCRRTPRRNDFQWRFGYLTDGSSGLQKKKTPVSILLPWVKLGVAVERNHQLGVISEGGRTDDGVAAPLVFHA